MFGRVTRSVMAMAIFISGMAFVYVARPEKWLEKSASAADTCQTFTETGKQVCGRFLDYWTKNGGLAQQGLPLTNEFNEVSDLNGQTYDVQYFERSVFEKHPENQAPYDVLLSQLGTFRLKEKYPNGDPSGGTPPPPPAATAVPQPPTGDAQVVTGTGTKVSDPVAFKKGLAVIESVSTGTSGNFIVELVDNTGATIELLANEIGAADIPTAINIPKADNFLLKVTAEGDWKITITQPTATYGNPQAHYEYNGTGSYVSPLISLKKGALRVKATHTNGTRNFIVELVDQNGITAELLANKIGDADIDTIVNIPANGVYLVTIRADGDYHVALDQ